MGRREGKRREERERRREEIGGKVTAIKTKLLITAVTITIGILTEKTEPPPTKKKEINEKKKKVKKNRGRKMKQKTPKEGKRAAVEREGQASRSGALAWAFSSCVTHGPILLSQALCTTKGKWNLSADAV